MVLLPGFLTSLISTILAQGYIRTSEALADVGFLLIAIYATNGPAVSGSCSRTMAIFGGVQAPCFNNKLYLHCLPHSLYVHTLVNNNNVLLESSVPIVRLFPKDLLDLLYGTALVAQASTEHHPVAIA